MKDSSIVFRIPKTTKHELVKIARTQGRSLSSLILERISCSDQSETKRTKEPRPEGLVEFDTKEADITGEGKKRDVKVRLLSSELDALDLKAKTFGCSRQAMLVKLVRNFLVSETIVGKKEQKELIETNLQLRKIGVNLNQIARQLNAELKLDDLSPDTLREIHSILPELELKINSQVEKNHRFLLALHERAHIVMKSVPKE